MQRLFRSARSIFFLFSAVLGASSLGAAELIHNPVLSAAAGQDIRVDASLVGATGDPRVRLFWRPKGKEIFRSVEMGGGPSALTAVIPGEGVDLAGVEYYLEAALIQSGQKTVIATSPASNPLLNPHSITVRKDVTGPEITPLSPADGEVVDSARPVITAAYADPDSGVDASSVLIKLDGEAVKDKDAIQAFESLVSYVPSADLSNGEHEITVVVRDKSGNPSSAKWKFTVTASSSQKGAAGGKKAYAWEGKFGAETQYGAVLAQTNGNSALPYRPYGLNKGSLDLSGRDDSSQLRLQVSKSDAERTDQQPVDRYTGTYKSRQGIVAVGDYSPNFSELSLWNLYQLRGVTLDLQSGRLDEGHTRLVGVWGQTRRGVEQGATSLAGGTGAASSASLAQYLYGARWEFGGPYFQLGLNSVTVNDQNGSVNNPGNQVARYNFLDTSDVRIGIPQIGLKLHGETGVDFYSDPTPLLGSSLGSAYRAGLDWNIKAWNTKLSFDWKDLGGGFGLLPGGYTTAANPGLMLDYRGYEGEFSQGLFDGQFNIDLNLNRWRDNLQGMKQATTTTTFFSVFTNIAPQQWPYLVVGYTQSGQLNDADGNTIPVGLGGPNLITDNLTSALNLGLGYTKAFGDSRTGSLNVNWAHQKYTDQAAMKLSQDLNNDTVTLSGFVGLGLSSFNASVGFGGSSQPGLTAAQTALGTVMIEKVDNSINTSLRWSQVWSRSVFDTYVGYDLATKNTQYNPTTGTGAKSTDVRNTFSLGGGYSFKPEQKLTLGLSFANAATDTDTGVTTTSDTVSELYSDLRYDLSF
jgi:hypothetical protein